MINHHGRLFCRRGEVKNKKFQVIYFTIISKSVKQSRRVEFGKLRTVLKEGLAYCIVFPDVLPENSALK